MITRDLPTTVNVQPHPRILSVLKDMEFTAAQSLAELCDNAFDEFLKYAREEPSVAAQLSVRVTLPRRVTDARLAEVWVVDNGRGMSLEQLNQAVRAGWSNNDPFDQLGLFGLGFNVASARLGQVCRVLSTRDGDERWHGVEIDLARLRTQTDFDVPVITEQKNDPSQRGTKIIISALNTALFNDLTRNKKSLRERLGDLYAPLLSEQPFSLLIDGAGVQPRRHCVWEQHRTVTFGSGRNAEQIPARIPFEKELREQAVCANCHRWQDPIRDSCLDCGSPDIHVRQRVIRGWIGVQRYLDTGDYGIDFIRNGRKILARDKSLFSWATDDGSSLLEYPVELPHLGGRIVGEVHVDYAKPSWRKDAFENEAELVVVKDFLRGDDGPLRPQTRRKYFYPEYAQGPLALIYRAFSVIKPGKRHLIPGNGSKAVHEKAREWADRFYAGDLDHQTDQKWWEAVVFHEQVKEARTRVARPGDDPDVVRRVREAPHQPGEAVLQLVADGEADEQLVRDIFGDIPNLPGDGMDDQHADEAVQVEYEPTTDAPETFLDRVDRYLRTGRQMPDLDGEVTVPDATRYVTVRALLVDEPVRDQNNQRVPVLAQFDGASMNLFVDASHPLFTEYDTEPVDVVVAELAEVFRISFDSEVPLAEIMWRVKDAKLADRQQRADQINRDALALLAGVRDRMVVAACGDPDAAASAWRLLDDADQFDAETTAAREGITLQPSDPELLRYVPALALPRLIEGDPGAWLDGKVFTTPWNTLSADNRRGRWLSVARVAGLLYDLGVLVTQRVSHARDDLRRGALSLPLLEEELVDDASRNRANAG